MAGSNEIKKLVRSLRPGYVVEWKGGHGKLFHNGEPVRLPDGRQITFPSSPSRGSSVDVLVRALRQAGAVS